MKNNLTYAVICSALLATRLCVAQAPAEKPGAPGASLSRADAVLVTVTASVESINLTNREVTLKGPLGNQVTFTVDKRVKRLPEVKVGDFVRADYYISIAAELRKPTAEEEKTPFVVLDAAGKAPAGTSPAAGGLRRLKIVATIEGLDRPTQTITVKGPLGNYLTTRVDDPSNLTRMRIGENIIVICTEALAISLEKADAASAK